MPPTTYRPVTAKPVAPQKNTGLMAGLIAAAVVAVIGLGLAGLFWSGKSTSDALAAQHAAAAQELAGTLGVTLAAKTNQPIVWKTAWEDLNKAAKAQKGELEATTTRAATAEAEVNTLQPVVTELAELKGSSGRQATQLKQVSDELASLKESSQARVAALEKDLVAAREAAAQAAATAAAAAGGATAEAGTEGAVSADATAATAAEGAAAEQAAATTTEPEEAVRTVSHTFPAGTTKLIKKMVYEPDAKALKVTLINDAKLTYKSVPADLFDLLVGAPVPDTYYRMKLLGNFPCTPDDKVAVRALSAKK